MQKIHVTIACPALLDLLRQCRSDQHMDRGLLSHLPALCAKRSALHRWVQDLWTS
jgi:hypothetical protein